MERKTPTRVTLDLLTREPFRSMVRWSAFPLVFQAFALVFVAALVAAGLGIGLGTEAEDLLILRKTNLATLVVWGLWWPGMVVVALAFGRAWCTICPMELVNRVGDAVARKLRFPRARLGKFLRAGWFVIIGYLVLQLAVAGLSIHRVPHFTAVLLLVLLGAALVTGLVFSEPRSFCRAFCPASALLSVYGRHTAIQLEVRAPSVCERCTTKNCVREDNRHRFDKRSCPSHLRPFDRRPSDGCVLCLQCVKVCPHDNVGIGLVSPSAPIRRKSLLRPHDAAFVIVALGFVTHELTGEVKWLDAVFHAVPSAVGKLVPAVPFGWLEALWFLVGYPLAVWALIAAVGTLAGHRAGIGSLLLAASTGAAPVVAVAHLAKAVAKLMAWIGFLPQALHDPRGVETLRSLLEHATQAPVALLGLGVVGWLNLVLLAAVSWKSWLWVGQVRADSMAAARAGMVGTALLFSGVLTIWSWSGP